MLDCFINQLNMQQKIMPKTKYVEDLLDTDVSDDTDISDDSSSEVESFKEF